MSQLFARAQGTIEYVVLLAIIVVIGLVVVVLASGFVESGPGVTKGKSELYWSSQDVGIVDSVVDSNGDGVFRFKNNGLEDVTITGLSVDGVDANVSSVRVLGGGVGNVSFSDLSPCVGGSRSYAVVITYTDQYGIQHSVRGEPLVVNCTSDVPSCVDSDGDHYYLGSSGCSSEIGFLGHSDCNDSNSGINPGAVEVCNGVDDDCDGDVDGGLKTTYYLDSDSDGYGDAGSTQDACSQPTGYVSGGTDCDDSNAGINSSVTEICGNGVDDDCDGYIDCTYIYLADTWDGLWAYDFNGDTFANVGHIDDAEYVYGVWGDGTYIYAIDSCNGLRAYDFNGSDFISVGYYAFSLCSGNWLWGDGTYIYSSYFDDGLYAYDFNGDTFTEAGRINDGIYHGWELGFWGDGNYIYLARDENGLWAYDFNGDTFTNVGSIDDCDGAYDVWGDDAYIYLASLGDGLRAYTFNGDTFTNVGSIDDGGEAYDVWGDGTYIYLANDEDGLRAYTFNGTSFTNVGHVNDGGHAIVVWSDGTYIYVTHSNDGLRAYDFNGDTFTNVGYVDDGEWAAGIWGET